MANKNIAVDLRPHQVECIQNLLTAEINTYTSLLHMSATEELATQYQTHLEELKQILDGTYNWTEK